ncbi:4-alpha-glucanotransferase [Microbacterium sediminicola]
MAEAAPSPELVALAEACGIATSYWSFFGERVQVPAGTLRAALAAMGMNVDADPAAVLSAHEDARWQQVLPGSVVVRAGNGGFVVHVPDGHDVRISVRLEEGAERQVPIPDQRPDSRWVAGTLFWRVNVPLPADLPLGWHELRAELVRQGDHHADRLVTAVLAVTPDRLAAPPARPDRRGRSWGMMAQLYSVRSHASWGMGDLADLADLSAVSAEAGADFLLVNPLHAAEVVPPIEPSPYLPATRRFVAPLYIRPEDIHEVAYLSPADRARVAALQAEIAPANTTAERIDRDATWLAKRAALEIIHRAPRSAARESALAGFVAAQGQPLADFALWCALEEHYGGIERPDEARDIDSPLVAELREQLADRVEFHTWLQWIAQEQAAAAHTSALAAGMRIGIMHDLAVGVHPLGSDAWSLRRLYADGITVGAPPDMYNQLGQDWNQPPWLPQALERTGYAALRDLVRGVLRHAGALRIDHILGFFRLWWIPAGVGPAEGTYVRYDHDAMIGVLALEAQRAGAVIIGEDLGLVEPWVRDFLSERGILGTSVLWFETEGERPTPPEHYRRALLATVNTHDLPPTAGYLAGEHVALRARLGLLEQPVEEALADAHREQEAVLSVLRERGLLVEGAGEDAIIEALHTYLVASPSELLGVALVDAVGERRVQNQPGTHYEYPNWQVPLADADGRAVLIDDLAERPSFRHLTAAVDAALRDATR